MFVGEQSILLPRLLVILGATASGKSALGITLAQRYHGEIVSADSRQVYRGLDIGTAKVTPEERELVPHHLLDVVEPNEIYTVSQFQQEATQAIDAILDRGHLPLLVGGSPHYIQAVIENLAIPQVAPQPELRAQLEARPLEDLLAELERLDPQSASHIDRNNPRRIIRALEVCLITGQPFSTQKGVREPRYTPLLLGIQWPREELYRRIDGRIEERMQQGLVQEVQGLLEQGLTRERLESFGLEYRFVSRWLYGEISGEDEMVQKLKYASHDFTRRQLSWFRKMTTITWLSGGPELETEAEGQVNRFLQTTSSEAKH
jgi:tRNA dimethylallyltransferase